MIETEISDLKNKQGTQTTADARKDRDQRDLNDNLQKPALMLDELKVQWERQLTAQTDQMKDLVTATVKDVLA